MQFARHDVRAFRETELQDHETEFACRTVDHLDRSHRILGLPFPVRDLGQFAQQGSGTADVLVRNRLQIVAQLDQFRAVGLVRDIVGHHVFGQRVDALAHRAQALADQVLPHRFQLAGLEEDIRRGVEFADEVMNPTLLAVDSPDLGHEPALLLFDLRQIILLGHELHAASLGSHAVGTLRPRIAVGQLDRQ